MDKATWARKARRKRGQDQFLENLRELDLELGHTPTIEEYEIKRRRFRSWPGKTWVYDNFGSWREACQAAGLEPNSAGFPHYLLSGPGRPGRSMLKGNPQRAAELGRLSAAAHRERGSRWAGLGPDYGK